VPARSTTLPPGGVESLDKTSYRDLLADARERTLWLVDSICDLDLERVHDTLMSPLVWDLGHIAAFEDLWLCHRAGGLEPLRPDLMEVYDATETPRAHRGDLPYLRPTEAREYMAGVRERALEVLDSADLSNGAVEWELVVRHEHQHNETMLQTLRLAEAGVCSPDRDPFPAGPAPPRADTARIEAGPFPLGAGPEGFAYDNERPRHEVHVDAFEIDRAPVTNGDYLRFVEEGGYGRRELWCDQGWAWRESERVERPLFWSAEGSIRSFDRVESLDLDLPVMHVSWYEADAYARWRGMRLPSEAEWEKAATWDPDRGEKRAYPWGGDPPGPERANLDQTVFGPAPVGAYPAGASPTGVLGLIGDAWEWTSSDFRAYPGFRAFPYREYSEIFFGDEYKVLRGGSWATRPRVATPTFRNWDYPQRRQIHCGFRCAADA
jgi:iron(II)-dependent oxidoreductase